MPPWRSLTMRPSKPTSATSAAWAISSRSYPAAVPQPVAEQMAEPGQAGVRIVVGGREADALGVGFVVMPPLGDVRDPIRVRRVELRAALPIQVSEPEGFAAEGAGADPRAVF